MSRSWRTWVWTFSTRSASLPTPSAGNAQFSPLYLLNAEGGVGELMSASSMS